MKRGLGFLIASALICCQNVLAQTDSEPHAVWVTNWIDAPPSLRVVHGRPYNTLISPRWEWLELSNSFRETGDDGADHAITDLTTKRVTTVTTSVTNDTHDEFHLTLFHFLFNPTNFVTAGNGEVRPAAPLRIRAMPIFGETNTANGHEVDSVMYDYGLPYTNKLPIRKLQMVQ
jgi:hypothetical protein